MQEALQAGDISPAQADAARERYAAIHRHFVQAMAKEKKLLDEAKLLNEELLVGSHNALCHTFSQTQHCKDKAWHCLISHARFPVSGLCCIPTCSRNLPVTAALQVCSHRILPWSLTSQAITADNKYLPTCWPYKTHWT